MSSLSPQRNRFVENEIYTILTCVFGHRSDIIRHHELQKLVFLK